MLIHVHDVLGRTFVFEHCIAQPQPAGALEVRYAAGHPEEGGLAALFAPGGWVALVEPGQHVEVSG